MSIFYYFKEVIIIKASQIRAKALERLKGNWKIPVLTILIYLAILFVRTMIEKAAGASSNISNIFNLAYFIISVPISFGLASFFIKFYNNENADPATFLKDGFNNFGRSWSVFGRNLLKVIVPAILTFVLLVVFFTTMILGMIGTTYYSLYGTQRYTLSVANLTTGFSIALGILSILLIVCEIWLITKQLLYVFSNIIAIENPELSAQEAVMESEKLMRGNRKRYFCLSLSFFGWAILSVLTLGIGTLWLMPYIQVSNLEFYHMVKDEKNSENNEHDPVKTNT